MTSKSHLMPPPCRCSSLAAAQLLRLTQHLAACATEAAGQPMLHDLASAAAEWLADPRQLGSAAPPRQPEAGAEADGGSGEALQHIDQVLPLPRCSRRAMSCCTGMHAGTCWHSAALQGLQGGWRASQPGETPRSC